MGEVSMLLITGCGRSGTKYTSAVLRQLGLDVRHEGAGKDGSVSSLWVVRDEYYPAFHEQDRPEFDEVLHQVRHPLNCIASLTTALMTSWHWNARHIDLDLTQPVLSIASSYWIQWNQLCERTAWVTYKVEDVPSRRWLNLLPKGRGWAATAESYIDVPKTLNSRPHAELDWKDLGEYEGRIRQMAERYGYL